MEEGGNNSWVRRAKFSSTVYHRLDSSRMQPLPLDLKSDLELGAKTKLVRNGSIVQPPHGNVVRTVSVEATRGESGCSSNRVPRQSSVRQRSVSPMGKSVSSDAFKDARSERRRRRRSCTPNPRRIESDRGLLGKFSQMGSQLSRQSMDSISSSGWSPPIRSLSAMNLFEKARGRKDSWAKLFDHAAGRVSAVETLDEWTVDLTKLMIGSRFSSGAHSKLYHGLYNEKPVAVKVICIPDDDENQDLASRLEKQFTREVVLLSKLHHQNVIKVLVDYW